jgi:chromosome segregation ATPase
LTLKTNQLTAANNDKIALENQVTERNTTIYGLNTQLTKAKSDYDDLVRVYNTLERQNSNLKDQIAKLQAEKPADQNNKNDTGTLYLYSTVGTGILCAVLLIMVMVYRGAAKRGKRAMR